MITRMPCPECGAEGTDFFKTGDFEVDGHRMRYYGCQRCLAKVSIYTPAPPKRTDMMG